MEHTPDGLHVSTKVPVRVWIEGDSTRVSTLRYICPRRRIPKRIQSSWGRTKRGKGSGGYEEGRKNLPSVLFCAIQTIGTHARTHGFRTNPQWVPPHFFLTKNKFVTNLYVHRAVISRRDLQDEVETVMHQNVKMQVILKPFLSVGLDSPAGKGLVLGIQAASARGFLKIADQRSCTSPRNTRMIGV